MEQTKKAIFRGVIDGVLDYLKTGYAYGNRAEKLDGFYCTVETYKEDYCSAENDDDYIATIDFTYGFYNPETPDDNFSNKGGLDIYYPSIFITKTPEQIHDIVYGMTLAYMQNREE